MSMATNAANISVVMATYNGALFLAKQLDSIIHQSLQPSEIIVCDDGSTDTTAQILEEYSKKYGLRFYKNETKLGVVRNFKKAVSLTSPDNFIALADQDDIWLPDKLKIQYEHLSSFKNIDLQKPVLVYSDLKVVDETGVVQTNSFWEEWNYHKFKHSFQSIIFGNFVTGCTILMNPACKAYFAEMPDTVEMHDAWIALIAFAFGEALPMSTPLVQYRKHAHNAAYIKSNPKHSGIKKVLDFCRKILQNDDFLQDRISMITSFLHFYKTRLTLDQTKDLEDFLAIAKKSYWLRKIYYEWKFKQYR